MKTNVEPSRLRHTPRRRPAQAAAWWAWACLVCAVVAPVQAATGNPLDPACATAPTQAKMNACAYGDFLAAGSAYTERYQALSKRLPATQRDRLRRMQSAWLNFRTAACRFESGPAAGGSVEQFVYWQCAARMTRERSVDLERLASCREGDIACSPARP